MAEDGSLELVETMDEIELARFRRMAVDALTGHFPISIYGDRDHTEVLARALERCVAAMEDDNREEVADNAKATIDELEEHISNLEGELETIFQAAEQARNYTQQRKI